MNKRQRRQLDKWLKSLPSEDRKRETEIAKRNMERIRLFLDKSS